jgi:hypothetical protein
LRPISAVSTGLVALGWAVVALLAWWSAPWPLIHDVALMHYVAWRIGDGAVPYRDLFDMNQPGTYLLHLAVLRTLGGSDLAWRVFDLAWLGLTAGLIAAFATRWGALAAAAGALVFATYHLAGGAWQAGQRDFVLCAFLLLGVLGVARALERRRWGSLAWSGAALGAGITLKPHAALFAGMLVVTVAVVVGRALGMRAACRATVTFVAAIAVAPIAVLGWLAANGGLAPWWYIVTAYLVPLYSRLGRNSPWTVYRWYAWVPLGTGVLLSLAIGAARRALDVRHLLAVVGVMYGLAHYVGQGKGWEYHLYPLAAFSALLVGAELPAALAARRWLVAATLASTVAVTLVLLDAKAIEAAPAAWWWDRERTVRELERELRPRLAPGDTVQVLDTTEGGLHALFRLHVREPTRFLYDFHFFHDESTPVVEGLRAELVRELDAHPPQLIVLFARGWPGGGYERVDRFPALAARLRERYAPAVTAPGYRVYAKRNDP